MKVGGSVRKVGFSGGLALAVGALSGSSAWAACGPQTQLGTPLGGSIQVSAGPAAAAAAIAGTIGNVNTAFLSQQGSAFVSAPGDPAPDQPGGGVWGRAIGGEVGLKSTSNLVGTNTATQASAAGPAGTLVQTTTQSCANNTQENFAGEQVGADIARLNWSGWNVHLGTTAGYLGARETDDIGSSNTVQVPFLGTYLVATHGRFFADLMVREEFYNINLNNPGAGFFNQPVGAHGFSVATSAGYNFDLGKGWFIEPSGGFIYSRTSVDNFNIGGVPSLPISGTVATNDIESEIGRLSLRVGTTVATPKVNWQPFFSASVFHEFANNVVNSYNSATNGAFICGGIFTPCVSQAYSQTTSTSRVGTYGQYSLGLAGQIVNTGWLGFVRVDYRNGDNINGWTGNAGIRYQFTPEQIAAVMPVKAPVKALPAVIAPTDWTGFYLGGFAGAAEGRTSVDVVGAPYPIAGNKPYVFGGLGGLELGYNREFANKWVVGVEADVGAGNVHGARPLGFQTGLNVNGVSSSFSPAFLTVQDQTNWMATATGRVGYAWGRTLIYGKGGVAFEDSSLSTACIFGPTGTSADGSRSCLNQAGKVTGGFSGPNTTRVGWTLGYGTEFDLGHNWSAKAEYDYMSFGSHTALQSDGTTLLTDKSYISQVKIGLNYRFTPVGVVAKY